MRDLVERIRRHGRCVVRGPAESGKSAVAERALVRRPGELEYVATLERAPSTAATIARHRARRDARWRVHEIHGEPERDLALLKLVLRETTRPVLIDGFVNLLARVGCDDQGRVNAYAGRVVVEVRDLLEQREAPWVLVDPDSATVRTFGLPGFAAVVEHFHAILAVECQAITLRLSGSLR